ncbi:hypothetical protein JAU75_21725 [Ochrobactrum sp. Q0168]|uniref:hypothetical protein n=1 Tax=Ochrobactrum sp. Q0168 TaxID=2793241 RepID=UPI0018EC4437|nr:hypothetical protein [Ochrobactrum sp. Q0168]
MKHTVCFVMRVAMLAAPILLALAALIMVTNPDGDRPPVPDKGVSGATAPTGN